MKKKIQDRRSQNVTMVDVANSAGVSVATVSNVLNQQVPVSDHKRKLVLKAIKSLGYQRNLAAQAFKTGVSRTIGLLVPNLSSPYFSNMSKMVIDAARNRDYIVSVIDTQDSSDKELESLNYLFQHGIQGVIWFDPRSSEKAIKIQSVINHLVIVDRHLASFDSIVPEYENGGFELAQYVLSQGHMKIGLISGPQRNYAARLRRKGILKALRGKATVMWDCQDEFSQPFSDNTREKLRRRNVSVVMCGSDTIALQAMHALQNADIAVPAEVSVTGFDDIFICELVSPRLTTVGIPAESIVNEAVDILIDRTKGVVSPRRHITLGVNIVIRESVSKIQ